MYHVSTLTILAIIFTMFVSIGGPVFLCFLIAKKFHAKLYPAVIGAAAFALFVLILESAMHRVVLNATGDLITGNIWLYGLYGGLAAGIFEETGRFLAMKFYMKKSLTKENALMYGVGHGGIEAVMIVGMSYISNLMVALMINANGIDSLLVGLDETTKEATLEQLSALWTLPSYQFFFAGVERISAMMLQIALSYLVYRAVKTRQMKFYGLAIAIHFAVDAGTVIASGYLGSQFVGLLILEGVLLIVVIFICKRVWKMYREETSDTEKYTGENPAGVSKTVTVSTEKAAGAGRMGDMPAGKKKTGIAAAANAVRRMEAEDEEKEGEDQDGEVRDGEDAGTGDTGNTEGTL